jgi:hypothetical protein
VAFTKRTITHTVENADGTPGSGSITFTLTKRATNGTTTILPSEITANLNSEGKLSQELIANTDSETIPTDTQWRVDFRLLGDSPETFYITVPSGSGSIDLGTLLPQQPSGG